MKNDPGEGAERQELPPIVPDTVGDDSDDQLDNTIPMRGYQMTPMVGLGASAGGVAAIVEFLKAVPPESGMAYAVVLHLSPSHESNLPSVLARATSMPVIQAENGIKVQTNSVYVIPPGKYLIASDQRLRLIPLENESGRRVAVDMFFRSLADTHGPHATAIVLSGLDGDGAQGIKRVKERGGLTIAQDPNEAEHPGMPRSAIDTGMIDWVLKAAEMPGRLLEYQRIAARLQLPPEEGPPLPEVQRATPDADEESLREILVFLRTRTSRDFACYKRATILRRIGRRMQVNGIEDLAGYVRFLQTHPGEAGALLQDMLISVTNFFRDREAFDALQTYIPHLFSGKGPADSVRVWVPACASGEEAYSFAMLLLEHASSLESPPSIQVFACDLSEEAIRTARAGYYPGTIEADVHEERLERFFIKEHSGYRVRREVREKVLFATHDLLKDAPFSRMDLISCRNLLIYLNREAQQRVFDVFHFSLKVGGLLFLGASEAVDDSNPTFRVIDKRHRIYAQSTSGRPGASLPFGSGALVRAVETHDQMQAATAMQGRRHPEPGSAPGPSQFGRDLDRGALAELHFKVLERYAPPSAIVNAEHDVIHLSEHAGGFLQFAGGEPTTNILRVVNPALRADLRTALFRAAETKTPAEAPGVTLEIEGRLREVDIRVSPVPEFAPGFFLVVFETRNPSSARRDNPEGAAPAARESAVRHLERELEQLNIHLRNTVEQYETSTEELKASNEELQAMNEELRSATEELETGREELQSINEELSTVNQEMKSKMDELARANSDLQNLMASTSIATVFLDRQLRITRFTPSAAHIFNMIPGDVGRPLADLKGKLEYPSLIADAEGVLRSLVPVEHEVCDGEHWYLARLQPYRTLEDHIAGAVLTLIDVTDRNRALEALRQSEERMRMLLESAVDWAIFTLDTEGRVNSWDSGAQKIFGYAEQEVLGQKADVLFTAEDRSKGDAQREIRIAREEGRAQNERWHERKDGTLFYGSGSVMPLKDKKGALRGYVKIMRDLTDSKRTQDALRAQMEELTRFNSAAVGRETRMIDLKREINALKERLGEIPRYKTDDSPGESEEK